MEKFDFFVNFWSESNYYLVVSIVAIILMLLSSLVFEVKSKNNFLLSLYQTLVIFAAAAVALSLIVSPLKEMNVLEVILCLIFVIASMISAFAKVFFTKRKSLILCNLVFYSSVIMMNIIFKV